jgi:hypothetical protein
MHNDYFLSVWVMLILVIGWESSAPVTKGPLAIGYRYMRGPFSFILKFYLFYLHKSKYILIFVLSTLINNNMDIQIIKELQEAHGLTDMQDKINSGIAWKLEGSYGRYAMSLLESGACMLPDEVRFDYYGNKVPSRDMLEEGTKGTFQNTVNFWTKVENGEIELDVN